jgi:hypothetical protein
VAAPRLVLALAASWLASPAFAQSADDDDKEDSEEKKEQDLLDDDDVFGDEDDDLMIPTVERIESADQLLNLDDAPEDEATEAFRDDEADTFDLLGDEATQIATGPGADTDQIYRAAVSRYGAMQPDEEAAAWEAYLAKYPNSAYKKRIDDRVTLLMEGMYGRVATAEASIDAQDREIGFAQALLLENIDPRTRLQAAFEWGIPTWFNLAADYEHALSRRFSLHGGIRRRYSGWSIEPGAHWALVKSSRTDTLVTVIGDLHLNTNPAFFGVRPQLALGKQVGKFDLQAQAGPDITFGAPSVGIGVVGGAAATFLASDTVALFLETALTTKGFAWEGAPFQFDTATFGMKFFPTAKDRRQDEINAGATVPYVARYWQYHFGSLAMQYSHYFE